MLEVRVQELEGASFVDPSPGAWYPLSQSGVARIAPMWLSLSDLQPSAVTESVGVRQG